MEWYTVRRRYHWLKGKYDGERTASPVVRYSAVSGIASEHSIDDKYIFAVNPENAINIAIEQWNTNQRKDISNA